MGADIPGVYSNFRSREISVPREPHHVPRQRYGRCETSRGDWNLGAGTWRGEWVPAPWYVGVRIGEAGHPGPERERHKGRKRKLTPEQSFKKQLALKKERAKAKLRRYQDKMKKPRNIRKVNGAKVDIRGKNVIRSLRPFCF